MTPIEAEQIIIDYSKAIKTNLRPHAIVQPISDLPCSPGKIRYAHFLYGEYLIKENKLTKKLGDSLISLYSTIHIIFVEDPDPINMRYREFMKKLDDGIISGDFNLSEYTVGPEWATEYNNFLADCQGRYNVD